MIECDGKIIASEGHIAAAVDFPITDNPKKEAARKHFAERWKAWSECDWMCIEPLDEVYKTPRFFIRRFGDAVIQEAFLSNVRRPGRHLALV